MEVKDFQQFRDKISNSVKKVIVGKEDEIDRIIVAFICSGHVLLEDMPGLGKTKLAKVFSKSLGCDFKRIQFTPDLLPSDLTGIYFYNQKEGEFNFRKGPLLSNFILADEINRATPRTQSALLECMGEGQITVEGNTLELERPFFVLATQNPIEQFGTFPLPEAQLDRFFMRLSLGYPNENEEIELLNRFQENDPLDIIESVVSRDEILFVQDNYAKIHTSSYIKQYIVDIVRNTRINKDVKVGCSPRGTLALMKGSQAYAAINGRDYVIPEDVKSMAPCILSHRLVLNAHMNSKMRDCKEIIKDILNTIPTPLEEV